MTQTIDIGLDSLTGAKLGPAKLTIRIADVTDISTSMLYTTQGSNTIPVEIEFTAGDAGMSYGRTAINWEDNFSYQPIISCDDDSVRCGFIENAQGNWTIFVTEGPKTTQNIYDEYMYVNGKWELIGDTDTTVDLAGYATEAYVDAKFDSIPDPDLTNCVMKGSNIDATGLKYTNTEGNETSVINALRVIDNKANADAVVIKYSNIDTAGLEFTNAEGMTVGVVSALQDIVNKEDKKKVDFEFNTSEPYFNISATELADLIPAGEDSVEGYCTDQDGSNLYHYAIFLGDTMLSVSINLVIDWTAGNTWGHEFLTVDYTADPVVWQHDLINESFATVDMLDAKANVNDVVNKYDIINDAGLKFANDAGMPINVVNTLKEVANKANASDVYTKDEANEKFVQAINTATVPIDFTVKWSSVYDDDGNETTTAVLSVSDAEIETLPATGYCAYKSVHLPDGERGVVYKYYKVGYGDTIAINLTSIDNPDFVEITTTQINLSADVNDIDSTSSTAYCTWNVTTTNYQMVQSTLINRLNSWQYFDAFTDEDGNEYSLEDAINYLLNEILFIRKNYLTKEVVTSLPTFGIKENKIYIKPKN